MIGNAAGNVLDGGTGNDTMRGGAGDDTYVVDAAGDTVTENANEGIDTVQSSVTWTLGSNLENLTLTGTGTINGTGNSLDNVLTGNSAANVLTGGAGNDTYYVGTGDTTTEAANAGTDTVFVGVTWTLATNVENLTLIGTSAINGTGNASANLIVGNSANNTLTGGTGADTLQGGGGNDTYQVDNTADVVVEAAGEGTDLVNASVTTTLAANVENLTLTGTTAINGTGNALDNVLTGNSAVNVLAGGAGNDTYYVTSGDTTTEAAGAGTDTVYAGVTWTLATNVENLTLTGTSAINGTGNTLDNVLTGNSAANVLTGGAGNDTYYVSTGDTTVEAASAGTDSVFANVTWTLATNIENLTLTGSSAINGTGNTLANVLTGNSGANTLTGGEGNDIYIGAAGNDTLNDTSATSADSYRWGVGQGNDSITDAGGADRIEIAAGVTAAQVSLVRSGNNLQVKISGATDVLTVVNWYTATANRVESIALADGTVINAGTAAPLSVAAPTTLARESIQMRDAQSSGGLLDIALSVAAAGNAASARDAQILVQAMSSFAARTEAVELTHWQRVRDPMHGTLANPM